MHARCGVCVVFVWWARLARFCQGEGGGERGAQQTWRSLPPKPLSHTHAHTHTPSPIHMHIPPPHTHLTSSPSLTSSPPPPHTHTHRPLRLRRARRTAPTTCSSAPPTPRMWSPRTSGTAPTPATRPPSPCPTCARWGPRGWRGRGRGQGGDVTGSREWGEGGGEGGLGLRTERESDLAPPLLAHPLAHARRTHDTTNALTSGTHTRTMGAHTRTHTHTCPPPTHTHTYPHQGKFWPTTSRVDNVYGDRHLVTRW